MKRKPAIARFVSFSEPRDKCVVWIGATLKNGYGQLKCGNRAIYAHRFAFEFFKGPIPMGLTVDHTCRNRSCVNPEHLEAVTARENILRGTGLASVNARKTHCPRGHQYSSSNTRIKNLQGGHSQGRVCRACELAYQKRYRDKG